MGSCWLLLQVLLWVCRASPLDMHRYLKCIWQLEQPKLIEKWLVRSQGGCI